MSAPLSLRVIWLHDQSELGVFLGMAIPRVGETIALPRRDVEFYRVEAVEHFLQGSQALAAMSAVVTLYVRYLGDAD